MLIKILISFLKNCPMSKFIQPFFEVILSRALLYNIKPKKVYSIKIGTFGSCDLVQTGVMMSFASQALILK